ncbi:RraA family protein [Acidaminobacter hydrogenoformans]|uniref:Putative 4-hydroxy-4-methyl-2-oxoglutarate aldolase n=1 Tax=Acidaminobacter hydrogenoformans DSM 2784 TaxID=1120920 RepID=A0A1G5S650_9FIRM|nr:RraA family protein [Acidaminobacter hydrogenoformans]SCZ81803.1 Regulator of RNase E activity RraA [Acidaminobacter hydrogenoformans DSM 2784]
MKDEIEVLEQSLITQYRQYFETSETYSEFKLFGTTEISDALKGKGVMDAGIKPLDLNTKIIGRAFTVQLPPGDGVLTLEAIEAAEPGDILVIHSGGTMDLAVWGDVKTIKAMSKRIAGVVVDGAIRDRKKNMALGFPVFSRAQVVQASGKAGGGELNVPVVCGGVLVRPGDLILGDADGVVVIPPEQLQIAVEGASKKLKNDEEKIYKVLTGGLL